MRNALGDIGNKLMTSSVNVNVNGGCLGLRLKKQSSQENNDLLKKTLKTTVTLRQQQQQPLTATFLNNRCLYDDDDDKDVYEILIDKDEIESGDDNGDKKDEECVVSSSDDDNHDEENLIQLDEDDEELNEDALLQAFTFPSKDVIDIDEEDKDNTQLCADYVKDIYYYLNALEKKYRVSPTFLERKIVSAKMRSILIDWLIKVHMQFDWLNETLYLSVQIVDAYLEVVFFLFALLFKEV
jgi:hypothetical protein